ncbi:MAG: Fe-S protein assembly chaperone HscA [SAR324 cluster bacterium]|nr:Fe-S protein assembly chaperone HscA [SAR324 cluster bacterium]
MTEPDKRPETKPAEPPASLIVGIDLGTTNSLAAAVFEHGPEAIHKPGQGPIVPSVLLRKEGRWVVGEAARAQRTEAPERTVFSVKRLMGRDIQDLAEDLPRLPYIVEAAQRGLVKVRVGDETFTPQELSAEILKAVKREAEEALGMPIERAVVTVPAYFDDAQRQATRDAGRIAGLEVVRIVNEPTAAAIAYGLDEQQRGTVAVYDLGGGTFDISILELSGSVFKVLSTHGDTHLGGDDFDHEVAQEIKRRILADRPDAELERPGPSMLLRKIGEQIKIDLSGADETPFSVELPGQNLQFSDVFAAETLNRLIEPYLDSTLESCRKALEAAGKTPEQIDDVVLVGGSSRIPLVRRKVEGFFGRRPNVSIDPDEVVAIGAGVQGHLLAGGRRDYVLLDVIPLSLGIETLGGTFSKLITANTTIPARATELFTTYVDNQTGVDLNIYQGEREFVRDCRNLGRFKLKGVPPMPAGLPKVEVAFLVDANGILTVSAVEQRSGQEAQIEVIPSHGLTNAEIERIMDEAIEHAVDDLNQRQMVEFRNMAQAVFQGIEKAWPEAEEMLPKAQRVRIRAQMEMVKRAADGENPIPLKFEMDKLGELTRPLADTIMGRAALTELRKFFEDHTSDEHDRG